MQFDFTISNEQAQKIAAAFLMGIEEFVMSHQEDFERYLKEQEGES